MLRSAVVIGLAALYDIVEGSNHDLPFALDPNGCVVEYQPNVDYYPPVRRAMMEGAGISHPTATKADDFSITYHKTYKVVRNLPTGLSYILHHCGTPSVFADLPADAAGSPVFVVPVKKWSSGLTTTYTFLEELDLIPHAVFLDNRYMSSACGQKLVACGVIATPPAVVWPAVINWTAEVEKSVSEVHFTDKPNFGTAATGLSIDVAFDASSDPGLLNRAEWLKFAAAFFNKEPEANRVFEDIRSRFEAIVEKVASVEKGSALPRVAFVSSPGAWSGVSGAGCPYGGYELKVLKGYKEHLVTHGGGTSFDPVLAANWCSLTEGCSSYICPNATAMKAVLKTTDVVIDETYSATPPSYTFDSFKANYGLTDDTSSDYPFLRSSRVYRLDKRTGPTGGSDWLESALPHADEALLDFALALVPQLKAETLTHAGESEVLADRGTHWLRDLAKGEVAAVVDVSECDDPDALGSSVYAVCPGDQVPAATPPIYNVCDNLFCIPTSLLATQADNAQMQATIDQLQADNAQVDKLLADKLLADKLAMEAEVFEISVTAAGTVDTFDKAGYETNMRTYLGCNAPLCQVAIAVTAGSVNVVATVTDTTSTAVAAAKKLTTDSTAALSTALGVTVEATPTVSVATKTTLTVAVAPAPAADDDDDNKIAMVGGLVGGLLGAATLCLLGCVLYMYSREKQGNPVFYNMDATAGKP